MRPQLRSELIKLTSTRTIYGIVIGAVAVVALSTWSTITSAGAANVAGAVHTQQFFFLASVNLAVFAVIVGIRAVTDEFRHGTVVSSVLTTGQRARFLAAKVIVAAGSAALLAALAQAAMLGLALLLTSGGTGLQVTRDDWAAMAGLTSASAMWAALGVAVGTLVRHQVAAIVGGVVWVLVVENLGAGLLGTSGRYLPGQAAHALAQLPDLLTVPVAALVITTYAAALLVTAHIALTRRDM